MKKNILSISALLIVLASCGRSEVCSCSDSMLEMSKEMRQVKGDYTKIEAIQKKYEADFKKCEKLGEGKSEEEKKKFSTLDIARVYSKTATGEPSIYNFNYTSIGFYPCMYILKKGIELLINKLLITKQNLYFYI